MLSWKLVEMKLFDIISDNENIFYDFSFSVNKNNPDSLLQ